MALIEKIVAPNGREIHLPTGLFINNEFVKSSGDKLPSINPADESTICVVEAASSSDVDKAVRAARAAFKDPSWSELLPAERGAMMHKLADLIEENKEDIATLEALDNGKPYQVALEEDLNEAVGTIRYYAGWTDKIHGQTVTKAGFGQKFAYTIRQPIGVCGQIIPWNYPLSMASWKLGPALACGNTVVLKPSEQTPLSILLLAKLIAAAGFPPGVVNIVNGFGRVAGHALASHMDVDKVAFTGSTTTGQQIMKAASANLKGITLETGGKSPILIFDDADLEQGVRWAHIGVMSNQGQICTSTSRILVQRGVYEQFLQQFRQEIIEKSVVGGPFEETTTQGPQVSKGQYERILDFIVAAKQEGATLFHGGQPFPAAQKNGKGFYIEPTVFTDVKEDMRIYREEIFGPVAVILPFDTVEAGLAMANDSIYGLGSAVFTKDIERALTLAEKLEAGMVWINSSQDSDVMVPFGGVKQSGIGMELGEAGLAAYTQLKSVHVNLGLRL